MKTLTGIGVVIALVLGGATAAQAADSPSPSSSASASAPAPAPAGVLTVKTKTAGTGTNFGGTYRVLDGATLTLPAAGTAVLLQRKTPAGWDTVTRDTTDENGNLVYGTVHSNYVQTWRLVTDLASTATGYGVSRAVRVAQHGKAFSRVTFPTPGFRIGKHVAFNGWFTYRSWWITSGPDSGKQGFAAPLNTHLRLQYWTGTTWRTKTTVLTEDRGDERVNAYVDVRTNYSTPSRWRWYYPGSATRTSAVSSTLTR